MKNFMLLLFVVVTFSACSVDSLDSYEVDLSTANLETQQSLNKVALQDIPILTYDLLHHQTGAVKGGVEVTNDCDNLYILVTGDNDEANLGLYSNETEFPKQRGANNNVPPGNLEYDQYDAVNFLWTFPLSDFEEDGVYIFVNSGAAWGGDEVYGSARYFYYAFGECPVETGGCTYGYGFWRNHNPIDNPGNQENEWPSSVDGLYLGNVYYSVEELVDILKTNVGGNGFVSLAHHLIAAKLNLANGANGSEIASTIEAADALIGDHQFGTEELSQSEVGELKKLLEEFNEGSNGCGGVIEDPCAGIDDPILDTLCSSVIENPTLQGFTNHFRNLIFLNTDFEFITGTFSPTLAELHAQFLEDGPVGVWTTYYIVTTDDCGEITIEVSAQVNDCD